MVPIIGHRPVANLRRALWIFRHASYLQRPVLPRSRAGDSEPQGLPKGIFRLILWGKGVKGRLLADLSLPPRDTFRIRRQVERLCGAIKSGVWLFCTRGRGTRPVWLIPS